MVGKNNTQERFRRNATKDKRYTLKKLSVGLASVALGTVLFLNGAETVSAEAEVVDPNTPAAQPVQETFQFNYLNQATGARLDGFFGDYVNANEAEKAFRHYANEQGYTLLNVRLEGHTFTADVAVEQEVQPEAQPAESTFQFIYRNKETGEKFDSFFGDYVNENEAEKDFRHYANQHGYTLLNVRLEGHTFTADVAVEQEAQPAESAFQFIYRDKETGEKFDSFFGDYENENEAEKDFRHYANQHGYTLLNVRQNGHTFTADVARDSQVEEAPQTPEVEKGYSYALNFDGRTESANLGEFDSEEQAELALRIFANEQGYELSNLRLEGRTFYADAKVAAEADEPSESTDRYLQEAKDRARGIINGLENLFDTQKPSYLERIEDADSVAAVEAIVEEAQNYVNEGKGGENGQAPEQPEKPEYTPEQNPDLVTYDLQITDQNGRTQTQRVTFPSRELALNYISQLVRSYEKAGVVLNEERSDVEGKDNTFILVFEEKQAEEPAKADYTVKVIIDGEERQSQALPDTTRQGAIDYAERLANSYEQDGFTYNHLDAGLPSDTVVRIELSSPKLDIPSHTEDAPAPEALDVTKAEALDIIDGLDLDNVIKDNLVYEINQAEDEAAVGQVIAKAYKIVAAGLAEEPTPELDLEEEAGRELDAAKAEALDAIAGLEYLSEEEKAGFVDRINETTELGEVNRLVGLAFKRNIENFPEKTPELDPEEEAGRGLDAAKAEALEAIERLEYLSDEDKEGFVDRINDADDEAEVNRLVGVAHKQNINNLPKPLDVPGYVEDAPAPEVLDEAKTEALDQIAELDYFTEEEKQDLIDRINEYDNLGDVDFIVSKAIEENDRRHLEKEAELQAAKDTLNAKINALVEDATRKAEFLAEVSEAETLEALERIDDNVDSYVSIQDHEELEAAKENALKELHAKATEKTNEIDQRIDLTEEEKDLAHTVIVANYEAGEEAINNATTAEEVAEAKQAGLDSLDQITIDGDAKQEAQNELHKVAQAKENEIEERIDLTEDEKTEAATKLVEEYNKAVEAINSAETNDDVTTAKDAGIQAINDIQLTPAAKQEAQNELHKVAQAKENEIEKRDDLTAEEKFDAADKLVEEYNKAVEAVNNAETNDDVTTAKDAGIKAINDIKLDGQTKGEAIENIDALPELTEGQKDTFKKQVDVAENEEEILEILAKADNRNELNRTVKEAIDGMPELTEEQRATYKKEVEEATSDDEVESVLSALENQAFENYVESAKDQVDKLTRLTPEEQQDFKNEIGGKASAKDIDEVLGRAYKQNVQKAIDANQAVAKAEDKAKEADNFLKDAALDGQITEDELEKARDNNADIAESKEKAQAEIDKLPENVRKDLQERLNKVKSPGLPPVTPSTQEEHANGVIDSSPLDQERKADYKKRVEANKNSDEKIRDILSTLAAEIAVKRAEDKAKAADEFLKEAAKDGLTAEERQTAADNNKVIKNLKEDAQTALDGLSESEEDAKAELQERLDQVNEFTLPPVTPSTKVKSANETIGQSPLDESRKKVYYDKVNKANSDEEIDGILAALTGEVYVKGAEDKAQEAADLVNKATTDGEVTEEEKDDIDRVNRGVEHRKGQAQDKLNAIPESVKDIKDELQTRLNNVQKATLPTDDTNPDGGDDNESPQPGGDDQTPPNQSDESDENSELKNKQTAATKALDQLSHLDDNQREQYKKDIENAQDESIVDHIVDKAQLENIKELNAASKKDKDAEGRKEVTVEEQEEAKQNIKEIKDRLNDLNNNLTQKQRKELQDLLNQIEIPRTHHYLPEIGDDTDQFFNTQALSGKVAHARVGWQANGQENGNGNVWNKTVNFSAGDDILEVRRGIHANAKINLGKGDDQLIVHGVARNSGTNVFRRTSAGSVDGGEGTDTVILKGDSTQHLHGQYIPNFDRVELNGTDGHFQIKLSEMKDQKLGGNNPLIVSGVAGKENTVDFDHKTGTGPRNQKYENKPGQTIGNWTAQPTTKTKDGKTYVVWRHKDSLATSEHDVWVENTLGVRG